MEKEHCRLSNDCNFQHKCSCSGHDHLLCDITYQVGGIFFVDKKTHPHCIAKTFFGDAHICLCPAKSGNS